MSNEPAHYNVQANTIPYDGAYLKWWKSGSGDLQIKIEDNEGRNMCVSVPRLRIAYLLLKLAEVGLPIGALTSWRSMLREDLTRAERCEKQELSDEFHAAKKLADKANSLYVAYHNGEPKVAFNDLPKKSQDMWFNITKLAGDA